MMKRTTQFFVAFSLATVPLAACTSQRDDRQTPAPANTGEAPAPAKPGEAQGIGGTDFAQARDRSVQEMQTMLAELDRKLTSLKRDASARSAELTAESKAALDDAIAKLEEQRAAAQRALEQARTSSAERWEQVKQRTFEILRSAEDTYEAAVRKLRG